MIYLKRFLYKLTTLFRPHRSRTVTRAFPAMVTTAALLGAAALLSQDASYVRIESSKVSLTTGEPFMINVYAGAHVPVNAIDIEVTFPKNAVEIKGIDTGESVITIWTQEPYVDGNTVVMRGGTFRKGFIGEHLIASINAVALQNGSAEIVTDDVMFLAGDGSGDQVQVSDIGTGELVVYVGNTDGEILATANVIVTTDVNGDGTVSLTDISSFMGAWAIKDAKYDFNNDNRMNFIDFGIILSDAFYK